jgi:hypothetical protein
MPVLAASSSSASRMWRPSPQSRTGRRVDAHAFDLGRLDAGRSPSAACEGMTAGGRRYEERSVRGGELLGRRVGGVVCEAVNPELLVTEGLGEPSGVRASVRDGSKRPGRRRGSRAQVRHAFDNALPTTSSAIAGGWSAQARPAAKNACIVGVTERDISDLADLRFLSCLTALAAMNQSQHCGISCHPTRHLLIRQADQGG